MPYAIYFLNFDLKKRKKKRFNSTENVFKKPCNLLKPHITKIKPSLIRKYL
jgi:hypothetical protein